jgi:hypothetical protein
MEEVQLKKWLHLPEMRGEAATNKNKREEKMKN